MRATMGRGGPPESDAVLRLHTSTGDESERERIEAEPAAAEDVDRRRVIVVLGAITLVHDLRADEVPVDVEEKVRVDAEAGVLARARRRPGVDLGGDPKALGLGAAGIESGAGSTTARRLGALCTAERPSGSVTEIVIRLAVRADDHVGAHIDVVALRERVVDERAERGISDSIVSAGHACDPRAKRSGAAATSTANSKGRHLNRRPPCRCSTT